MKNHHFNKQNSIHELFSVAVNKAVNYRAPDYSNEDIQNYLTRLMIKFLHTDNIFGIKNDEGKSVHAVADMVQEGDVTLNAESFEKERLVHKHIGDYILFWSATYPQFLNLLKAENVTDTILDYDKQGRESYYVASTFDYNPHREESKILKQLSVHFDDFKDCLILAKNNLPNIC